MTSRIPRATSNSPRQGDLLSPLSLSKPTNRSVSAPARAIGSPPPKVRPRANTRIPSPVATPESSPAQSKSYFRPRVPSPATSPFRAPSPVPRTKTTPKTANALPYTTRRPVPAYSAEASVPRPVVRKASAPVFASMKLNAMPIQSLVRDGPLPMTVAPAKTIGPTRGASFSLMPKLKAKPLNPPEPPKSAFLRAVPAKVLPRPQAMSMNVPPHIRLRLRLIHQLSIVLEIPPSRVSAVLDVPGLLARVDGVFEKGSGMKREREGSVVSIPGETKQEDKWWMYPPNWKVARDDPKLEAPSIEEKRAPAPTEHGVLDKLRKLGKKGAVARKADVEATNCAETDSADDRDERNPFAWMGSAFGVPVMDLPAEAWCRTRFGGQVHELPLVLYLTIEHIWKHGGIAASGIFRLSGSNSRVEHLTEVFAKPPLYGDQYPLQPSESPHNMACVLKRWLRDLPEPIVDDAIGPAMYTFCVDDVDRTPPASSSRIAAARILLHLLPPPSFSIMTYLLAFLSLLAVTIENKLGRDAIAIIFGPALIASRSHGVPGLGPRSKGCKDPDAVSVEVDRSQKTLGWLVAHWPKIAEGIMDCPVHEPLAKAAPITPAPVGDIDRRLLSPIDIRNLADDTSDAFGNILSEELDLDGSGRLSLCFDHERQEKVANSESYTGLGLISKAFSSRSISSLAGEDKVVKKSQSFQNLSGMLKRTLTSSSAKKIDPGIKPKRDLEFLHSLPRSPTPFPVPRPFSKSVSVTSLRTYTQPEQVSSVLGNLKDLLSTKDHQIERDARELAILRHTLLEMDEKLQRCSCSRTSSPHSPSTIGSELLLTQGAPPTPEITITATDSSQDIKDSVVLDLQSQLSTAMSALESARVKNRTQAEKISHLEASVERTEKWYVGRVKEKEGELALEIARGLGWRTERDVARRRLEKVKEDLFGVSG